MTMILCRYGIYLRKKDAIVLALSLIDSDQHHILRRC